MERAFVKGCNWLGLILLLLSILTALLDLSVLGSNYFVFYGISMIGFIIGFMGWVLVRFNTVPNVTKWVGKTGFYGNLALLILFFPPVAHIWGTLFFGP
ncbi:hypothetical protein [Pontibacillus salipaludis]|uniref:Uncharacterized protein n=1 Tax=Pontibacillus salipaludis TaxID=1697394 RepID=A0ABQ1Q1F8_9BACI|nr:hypothetical protein [Pontibacillus salipaludis]GGD09791.1 hypothetical protein GCM10011389_16620 [Pontibacillus salipaludis]